MYEVRSKNMATMASASGFSANKEVTRVGGHAQATTQNVIGSLQPHWPPPLTHRSKPHHLT